MSTHVPGFQSFFRYFASFCIGKLATSSMRVNSVRPPSGRGSFAIDGLVLKTIKWKGTKKPITTLNINKKKAFINPLIPAETVNSSPTAMLKTVTSPGPVLPVFWTGSFLKTSNSDRQIFL